MLRVITIIIALLVGGGSSYLMGHYDVPFWMVLVPGATMAVGFALGYLRGHAAAVTIPRSSLENVE